MVNEIGNGAFEACYSLEKIELPKTIICLGKAAFLFLE